MSRRNDISYRSARNPSDSGFESLPSHGSSSRSGNAIHLAPTELDRVLQFNNLIELQEAYRKLWNTNEHIRKERNDYEKKYDTARVDKKHALDDLEELKTKNQNNQIEIRCLRNDLAAAQKEIAALQKDLVASQKALAASQKALAVSKSHLDESIAEAKRYREERNSLKAQGKAKVEVERLKGRFDHQDEAANGHLPVRPSQERSSKHKTSGSTSSSSDTRSRRMSRVDPERPHLTQDATPYLETTSYNDPAAATAANSKVPRSYHSNAATAGSYTASSYGANDGGYHSQPLRR